MTDLKTSVVLDLAADAIQMAGWGKGPSSWTADNDRGLCLEGGIAAAVGLDKEVANFNFYALQTCPAYKAVQEYLGHRRDLWSWNDRPQRTQQEVIEVLRAAAAVERVKEETVARGYETTDQPLPLDVPETSAA